MSTVGDRLGEIAFRLRQQFRVAHPLGRSTQIIAWDEALFQRNATARTAAGFDQNRLFVGLGFPLRPAARDSTRGSATSSCRASPAAW